MRKYTKEEKEKHWMARCPECGWKGLTIDCGGFTPNGDAGDYNDGYCPKCGSTIDDADVVKFRIFLWFWRRISFWIKRREHALEKYLVQMEGESLIKKGEKKHEGENP